MQFALPQDDLVNLYRHATGNKLFATVGSYWKSIYMFGFLSSFLLLLSVNRQDKNFAKRGKIHCHCVLSYVQCNEIEICFGSSLCSGSIYVDGCNERDSWRESLVEKSSHRLIWMFGSQILLLSVWHQQKHGDQCPHHDYR